MAFGMIQHGGLAGLGAKKTKVKPKAKSTKWTFPDINSVERKSKPTQTKSRLLVLRGTAKRSRFRNGSEIASELKQRFISDGWNIIEFDVVETKDPFLTSQGEVALKISALVESKYSSESARQKALQIIEEYTIWDVVNGSYKVLSDVALNVSQDVATATTATTTRQPKPKPKQSSSTSWNVSLPNFSVPIQENKAGVLDTINNGLATFAQGQIITAVIAGIVILFIGKWLLKD